MKHAVTLCLAAMAIAVAQPSLAADIVVTMRKATQDGTGEILGTIAVATTEAGTAFKLNMHGLRPGAHGFHVHENANCGPTFLNGIRIPAGAAGDHFDPENTGLHQGPLGEGHLGDLPIIDVEPNGTATQTLTAPRIKAADSLKGHSLIIQIGGDNYSDSPALGGGGGGRFACGAIE